MFKLYMILILVSLLLGCSSININDELAKTNGTPLVEYSATGGVSGKDISITIFSDGILHRRERQYTSSSKIPDRMLLKLKNTIADGSYEYQRENYPVRCKADCIEESLYITRDGVRLNARGSIIVLDIINSIEWNRF